MATDAYKQLFQSGGAGTRPLHLSPFIIQHWVSLNQIISKHLSSKSCLRKIVSKCRSFFQIILILNLLLT